MKDKKLYSLIRNEKFAVTRSDARPSVRDAKPGQFYRAGRQYYNRWQNKQSYMSIHSISAILSSFLSSELQYIDVLVYEVEYTQKDRLNLEDFVNDRK